MLSLFLFRLFLWPVVPYVPAEREPVFTPDSLTINYGTIDYNADGFRELGYTNTGKAPLVLDVKSSCGCLVPYPPREPVMPGKRGVIGARYDTRRVGIFTKTLTVTSNEPGTDGHKYHVITVKGTVRPEAGLAAPKAGTKSQEP